MRAMETVARAAPAAMKVAPDYTSYISMGLLNPMMIFSFPVGTMAKPITIFFFSPYFQTVFSTPEGFFLFSGAKNLFPPVVRVLGALDPSLIEIAFQFLLPRLRMIP